MHEMMSLKLLEEITLKLAALLGKFGVRFESVQRAHYLLDEIPIVILYELQPKT